MATSVGHLIRDARARHGIGQRALARRVGTSQAQVSRIERGLISPSVTTLDRLLAAVGERLELGAQPRPGANLSAADRRAVLDLAPGERVAEAAALSTALTSIAAGARGR